MRRDSQFTFIEFPGAAHITELFRRRLDRAFAACGLDAAAHCVILPRLAPHEFVAAIGQCDIILDSIGWSGCNSTLESLVHDLPIVTLTGAPVTGAPVTGALMRGRHTAAILEMMGVTETIAATIDDYVSIAARLALDKALRTTVKTRMAQNKHRVYRDRTCIVALEEFLDHVARHGGSYAQ